MLNPKTGGQVSCPQLQPTSSISKIDPPNMDIKSHINWFVSENNSESSLVRFIFHLYIKRKCVNNITNHKETNKTVDTKCRE
jgi:hypothetical protein